MLLRKFIKCFKITNKRNIRQYRIACLLLAADHTLQTAIPSYWQKFRRGSKHPSNALIHIRGLEREPEELICYVYL